MPEVSLNVGGRSFSVVCDDGQEAHLERAAAALDAEAAKLKNGSGRVPESRMLLMAGLMLADRIGDLEGNISLREQRIQQMHDQLRAFESQAAVPPNGAGGQTGQASELKAAQAEAAAAKKALQSAVEKIEQLAAAIHDQAD